MTLPTFCIVTFRRQEKLRKLVDSIMSRYPMAQIVVADNGIKLPKTLRQVRIEAEVTELFGVAYIVMPFDCGLAAARNHLVKVTEGDIVILDDDFEFTDETNIVDMQKILAHDRTIGVVCGDAGTTKPMLFPEGAQLQGTRHMLSADTPHRQVAKGGPYYRECGLADNFMLVRREVFQEGILWNPDLKLHEHYDWFFKLHQSRWKVVHAPHIRVKHEHDGDTEGYCQYRSRTFGRNLRSGDSRPPVVVLGCGHSGTRIVVRTLEAFGWNLGVIKEGVAENLAVQEIDKGLLARRDICPCGSEETERDGRTLSCRKCKQRYNHGEIDFRELMDHALADIAAPWCIKDPRMVLTLQEWMPSLDRYRPFLLHVERDMDRMKRTYDKYGFTDHRIYGFHVSELVDIARTHYAEWPYAKLSIKYEQLANAVRAFDLGRAT